MDISNSVVGQNKTAYDLAMSLLTLGRASEAKRALAGASYDHERASHICDFLARSGRVEELADFVRCTSHLRDCDRKFLYVKLLGACEKSGDADAAEEAWNMMQEEGFVPSRDMLRAIAEVLEAAGREVPFQKPAGKGARTKQDVV